MGRLFSTRKEGHSSCKGEGRSYKEECNTRSNQPNQQSRMELPQRLFSMCKVERRVCRETFLTSSIVTMMARSPELSSHNSCVKRSLFRFKARHLICHLKNKNGKKK